MEKEPPKLYEDSTSNKEASVESLLWEANGKVILGKLKLDYIVKLKKENILYLFVIQVLKTMMPYAQVSTWFIKQVSDPP